jgi:dolichol kinase
LLIGCALPIWLSSMNETASDIQSLSGILSLGVGDTLASVVGKAIGNMKWYNRRKSVEGTVAFVLGLYASFLLVGFSDDKLTILFICLLTGT